MPAKCCAYNCRNVAKKGDNVSFYKFPSDELLSKRWVIAIRRDNFVPSKYHRLCSKHFTPDCILKRLGGTVLKEGAVPTIFNFKEPRKRQRKNSVAPAEPNLKKEKLNDPILQSEEEDIASETITEDLEYQCPQNESNAPAEPLSKKKKSIKRMEESDLKSETSEKEENVYETIIKDLKSVIEINELKMKYYEAELEAQKDMEGALNSKIKLLEYKLNKLTSELEESEIEKAICKTSIKRLESTIEKSEMKLKDCKEKLDNSIIKINKSRMKCQELELKLKGLSKAELKSQNNMLERKVNNLALKLEASEEENNLYAINIKNLESIIKTNEAKLKSCEEELASMKKSEAAMKSLINEINI